MIDIKFEEVVEKFKQLTAINNRMTGTEYARNVLPMESVEDHIVNGVYWVKIGNPTVLYTAHYDTAGDSIVTLESKKNMPHIMYNKDNGILGADDKAGLTVLSFMIKHKIEGLYVFFGDEESGASQSRQWIDSGWEQQCEIPINTIKAAIAFDRKGYSDIIQTQRASICCSMQYAEILSSIFSMGGFNYRPADGAYTDTANMIYKIPECTNISIGYFNQHTPNEEQDMLFLWKMVNFMVNNHKSISEIPAFKKVEVYKQYVPTKTFGHNYYSTGDERLTNGKWYSETLAKKKDIHNMNYSIIIGNKHPIMQCLDECYDIFESETNSNIIYEIDKLYFLHITKDNFDEFELEFISCIPNILNKYQTYKIDCYTFMATILSVIDIEEEIYIDINHNSFRNNYKIEYSEAFTLHIFKNQLDEFIEASDGFNEELQQTDGDTEELPEFID